MRAKSSIKGVMLPASFCLCLAARVRHRSFQGAEKPSHGMVNRIDESRREAAASDLAPSNAHGAGEGDVWRGGEPISAWHGGDA